MKLIIIRQLHGFDPYIQAVLTSDPEIDNHPDNDEVEDYLDDKANKIIQDIKKRYPEFGSANFFKRFVNDEDDQ